MEFRISLLMRSAMLATVLFAACFLGHFPAASNAQTTTAFQSSWAGTNLLAVMADRASVSGWILPADSAWFAEGYSGNLLIIEQRWQMARGASVDAACAVTPPDGEVAELMPVDSAEGGQSRQGFLDGEGARALALTTVLASDGKPQVNLRALILAHSNPLVDPIVVHIQLIAF